MPDGLWKKADFSHTVFENPIKCLQIIFAVIFITLNFRAKIALISLKQA